MLTATGSAFIHMGVPDVLVVYGGCPAINDFDVLAPAGLALTEFSYPNSGDGAVISQQTTNAANQTATVFLSGFSYPYIRDAVVGARRDKALLQSVQREVGRRAPVVVDAAHAHASRAALREKAASSTRVTKPSGSVRALEAPIPRSSWT